MKLWRNLAIVATAVVAMAACSDTYHASDETHAIVIDPTVSRASELYFDSGDHIGVTVIQNDNEIPYLSNKEFTCNGTVFTAAGIVWYSDITKNAAIRAYYPYSADGEPQTFTVKSDQRNDGYTQSDFMTAANSDVRPSSNAVPMVFRHRLARINIVIINGSSGNIIESGILSCALTATVDVETGTAVPYAPSERSDIIAHETESPTTYNAIIAPQSSALTFYVKLDDGSEQRCISMTTAEFEGGKQYTATLAITDNSLDVKLNGQIEEWGENTDLTPDNSSSGDDDDNDDDDNQGGNNQGGDPDDDNSGSGSGEKGVVNWDGVNYPTVKLADGRTWFAANLRYIPSGKSVSGTPNDNNGIWYPCNSDKQAIKDEAQIAKYGYLYSAAVAHGGSTSAGNTAVQGICPTGWHLPTETEFEALKKAYDSVEKLQASEFGFVAGGSINAARTYFYRSNGSLSGEVYLWSSSVTGDGTYCFMAKADSQTAYAYSSGYNMLGASVRCIKDE